MTAFRKAAFSAALPIVLLLQACNGKEPGFRQDIDVSQHLASVPGIWQDQPVKRTQVKLGADSAAVTVEWTPAHNGAHRGISRISVLFPEHRKGDTYQAAVPGTPANMGTREAILESLTLQVQWARDAATQDQAATALVHLKGDGTSSIL
jgi:hypothetical protein